MLGDHVGFFLGRFLGPRLHHTRLFIRHADRILKTETMIARWGAVAVPIGRFVPAIRSIVPALLGTSGFAPRRFIFIDTLSCATWAGALVLLATGVDKLV
jgi:membrane-associated protein